MTIQKAYEQIVKLTTEIKKSGVGDNLIEAAKTGNPSRIENAYNTFKQQNPELLEEIYRFNKEYNCRPIFKGKGNRNSQAVEFDCKMIDPVSMFIFLLLIEYSERELFEDYNVLVRALEYTKNYELARYVLADRVIGCVVETFWNIFYKAE